MYPLLCFQTHSLKHESYYLTTFVTGVQRKFKLLGIAAKDFHSWVGPATSLDMSPMLPPLTPCFNDIDSLPYGFQGKVMLFSSLHAC